MKSQAKSFSLGGIRIDALTQSDLIQLLTQAGPGASKLLIANHNLHSLYLFETNRAFRDFYANASWIYIDGLPVVWVGKAIGLPLNATHRITFLDCFDAILDQASQYGWRVFYLGSSPDVNEAAMSLLRAAHPKLIIGGHHGFITSNAASERAIAEINAFGTDLLFVGMGMPIQEIWLAKHHSKINARAILTSGGTLDYVTGHSCRPPKWAGRLGLYGIFRLLCNPKRLWHRYLIEPLFLARYLIRRLVLTKRASDIKWTAESG